MNRNIYLPQALLHRWICTLTLLMVGWLSAMANTSTFYYNATVTATLTNGTTGGGKVYVTTNGLETPEYKSTSSTTGTESQSLIGASNGSRTFYYYASPDDEYIFSHWTDDKWDNATHEGTDGVPRFYKVRTFDSDKQKKPTTFQTFAIFKMQNGVIKVQNTDITRGTVDIQSADNTYGDVVTIYAYPDKQNSIRFLGWKKNNTGDYVSTEEAFTLTASTETEGTYYAYFSEPSAVQYCRIQNKKTGRFLSSYGSKDKRVKNHQRTVDNNTRDDGYDFENCLKLLSEEEAFCNPSTVFKLEGNAAGQGKSIGVNLTAQGASYLDFVNISSNNNKLTMVTSLDGTTQIFTPFSLDSQISEMNSYFCDEGTGNDWLVMKTTDGLGNEVIESSEWTVYILDENTMEGAFSANAKEKFTKDNMYYTTMFTDFSYKLLDGVKAYYLVFNEDFTKITDRVVFTEVEGGIVPANTAVVLECPVVQNSNGTVNRLLPTNEKTELNVDETDNFMKGYISTNGQKRTNDKDRMYVLSSKNGKLGFYHSNNDNMTPNKAYLLAPEATKEEQEHYSKILTFSFGNFDDMTPTEILFSNRTEDVYNLPVFDLLGRKVSNGDTDGLKKGIYIRGGKKYVVR